MGTIINGIKNVLKGIQIAKSSFLKSPKTIDSNKETINPKSHSIQIKESFVSVLNKYITDTNSERAKMIKYPMDNNRNKKFCVIAEIKAAKHIIKKT